VNRGEIVWIDGWSHRRALAMALAKATRRTGARAEITLTNEAELLHRLRHAPLKELRRASPEALRLARSADVCLELGGPHDGGSFAALPGERLSAYLQAEERIEATWRGGEGRGAYLQLGLDTAPRAARYGYSLQRWRRQLVRGVGVPPETLEQLGSELFQQLSRAPGAALRSAEKSVLRLSFEAGSSRLDAGRIDPAAMGRGQRYAYLPAGLLSVRTKPAGTEGRLSLSGPFILGGAWAYGIVLEVRRGRVASARIEEGRAAARSVLQTLAARRERASILHLGINPQLRPMGYFGDRAAEGTLTITFGDDRLFGGTYASPVALDLCTSACSLELGPGPEEESGRLVIRRRA